MRMGLKRGAAVVVGTTSLLVMSLTSGTAHAAAINNSCGGSSGGGYDPNQAKYVDAWSQETGVGDDSNAVVELKVGKIGNTTIAWAKLYNASVGDGVSLRWSDDGGANYHRCGRPASAGYATITSGGDQYTLGTNSVSGRGFKACAHDASADVYDCTPNDPMWIYPS